MGTETQLLWPMVAYLLWAMNMINKLYTVYWEISLVGSIVTRACGTHTNNS